MNESDLGVRARHAASQEQKPIGLRAVAAAVLWPRKRDTLTDAMQDADTMIEAMVAGRNFRNRRLMGPG